MKITLNIEDFEPCDSKGICLSKCPLSRKNESNELYCDLRYISEEGSTCFILDNMEKDDTQTFDDILKGLLAKELSKCRTFEELYNYIGGLVVRHE